MELMDADDGEIEELSFDIAQDPVPAPTAADTTFNVTNISTVQNGRLLLPIDSIDTIFNKDAEFLNELGSFIANHASKVSKRFMPSMNSLNQVFNKGRRVLKKELLSIRNKEQATSSQEALEDEGMEVMDAHGGDIEELACESVQEDPISAPKTATKPLEIGQYVDAVLYSTIGDAKNFRGMIVVIYEDEEVKEEVTIRFMKAVDQEYTWPETDDLALVAKKDIVKLLPPPSIVQYGRTVRYRFD